MRRESLKYPPMPWLVRSPLAFAAILALTHGMSFGQTIADYNAAYLNGTFTGQSRAARVNDGWDYKTNSLGTIGTSSNYTSIPWSVSIGAYWIDTTSGDSGFFYSGYC